MDNFSASGDGFGMEMSLGGWKGYDLAVIEYHNLSGLVICRMKAHENDYR
jgi:hypothetical protein